MACGLRTTASLPEDPHGSSQLFLTPVPGHPVPSSSGLLRPRIHIVNRHTFRQNTQTNKMFENMNRSPTLFGSIGSHGLDTS